MGDSETGYVPDEQDLQQLVDAGIIQEDDNDEDFEDQESYDDEEEESEGFGTLAQKPPQNNIGQRFTSSIHKINSQIGVTGGVCAKQLEQGDVAWRCLDCEKDPTCIICSSCFEKSDHTGHRVQLKRNVSGLCDCGDPEAWDPDHFCSDHKGGYVEPEQILSRIPAQVRKSAESVFDTVCITLKKNCLMLINLEESAKDLGMTQDETKGGLIEQIDLILDFLSQRMSEVPAFVHIVAEKLFETFLDQCITKNKNHTKCCLREFPTQEREKQFLANLDKLTKEDREKVCTCSVYDLLMQINFLVTNKSRRNLYDFTFKMFKSYDFQLLLTLSYASNYEKIAVKARRNKHEIFGIGVQILTSAEMTLLILKNAQLLDIILNVLEKHFKKLAKEHKDETSYLECIMIMVDIKYMARPECLPFIIQNTNMVERIIGVYEHIYFCESMKREKSMIQYMQDGGPNDQLLNLELQLIKILSKYLREVKHNDLEKNQSILVAFLHCFQSLDEKIKGKGKRGQGIYLLPIHRAFSFYFTRLLFFNLHDKKQKEALQGLGIQQAFRLIFKTNLPSQIKAVLQQTNAQTFSFESPEKHKNFDFDDDDDEVEIKQLLKSKISGMFQKGEDKLTNLKEKLSASAGKAQGSSLIEEVEETEIKINEVQFQSLDGILKSILLTQIKQISFIHEISARRWIYNGHYLEVYPQVYFNLCDKLSYQDLCLTQVLLTMDSFDEHPQTWPQERLINFLISHFGIDKQLQTLFKGLTRNDLMRSKFEGFQKFDSEKLRAQLIFFLRFLAQICIYESSYVKQLYRRKDEKDQRVNEEFKEVWGKVAKREAVHLLMKNKVNANIQVLKQGMVEIFPKDEVFEQQLFEVSSQSRDIKNQVTFKLKDELYPWFDPFFYISFDQHSQVFQVYEQNQLGDKFVSEGLNDIVGDYKDNYHFATDLNYQIQENLARSQILDVVIPLLSNWLKFRKEVPKHSQESDGKKKSGLFEALGDMLGAEDQNSAETQEKIIFRKLSAELRRKLSTNSAEYEQIKSNSSPKSVDKQKSSSPQKQTDDLFLNQFVDINVASHCLKILILIIQAFLRKYKKDFHHKATLTDSDQDKFMSRVLQDDGNFINQLQEFKEDSQKENIKMAGIIEFILKSFQKLDPSRLQSLNPNLISSQEIPTSKDLDQISQKSELKKNDALAAETKKEKMKKRQNKLMEKMKSKGKKMLQNSKAAVSIKGEAEVVSQEYQCAFCQEYLSKENFFSSPFGNFTYSQSSKLYYHVAKRTEDGQRQALKNENLAQQFQDESNEVILENPPSSLIVEEEKQPEYINSFAHNEKIQSQQEPQIPEASNFMKKFLQKLNKPPPIIETQKFLKPLSLVEEICNRLPQHEVQYQNQALHTTFMNVETGSSSILTKCKHYSHLECLRKYHLQQETQNDNYQKQLTGLSFGEFACPICKSICNGLMPSVSFEDVTKLIPELNSGQRYVMTSKIMHIMDFYVDFFSELIKAQRGHQPDGDPFKAAKSRSTVLRDVYNDPALTFCQVIDHFVHVINLTDIQGLNQFYTQSSPQLILILTSLKSLIRSTLLGEHETFGNGKNSDANLKSIEQCVLNYLADYVDAHFISNVSSQPVLFQNLSNHVFKILLISSLIFKQREGAGLVNVVIQIFQRLIHQQFNITVQFRKKYGVLKGDLRVQESEDTSEAMTQVKLGILRKMFLTAFIVNSSLGFTSDDIFKTILSTTEDSLEVEVIQNYLETQQEQASGSTDQPDGKLAKIQEILQKVTSIDHVQVLASRQREFQMPTNMLLMTPYFQFDLVTIPTSYLELQTTFYKRKCYYCNKEKQDTATCLLCGQTMCWFKVQDGPCRGNPGQLSEINEGLLSFHARLHEGSSCIFIQTSSGSIIMIHNGSSAKFDTPYRNKYGELADPNAKKWDSFNIDAQGGGLEVLKNLKKKYLEAQIANTILQQRTNPDVKYTVYLKHAL